VNKVPRPNSPRCTYYHQIGHQINECPFIEDNVKQGFVEHFQNLNLEPARIENHGHIEPKDLYHERVRILNRLRKQIWRDNIMEMIVQIVANIVPVFVTLAPNLLHHNNVGVTYVGTSNFRMELVRYVPLYYVAMP